MVLSIVIPAFNAQDFIEFCVTSCCNQGFSKEELEIIIVNDGSSDKTQKIVEELSLKYSQVRLINQKNKGNGAARNAGIKEAQGKYLYFLDADDYLAKESLFTLIRLMDQYELEIIGFKSVRVTNNTLSEPVSYPDPPIGIMSGIQFLGEVNYDAEVWWYISKRDFLLNHGFKFYDRKFVQDSFLTPTHLSKAKKVAYIDWPIHRYRVNKNSITKRKDPGHYRKHFADMQFAITKLGTLLENLNEVPRSESAQKMIRAKRERYVFLVFIRFIISGLPVKEIKPMIKRFRSENVYPIKHFLEIPAYNNRRNRNLVLLFNQHHIINPLIFVLRIIKYFG